MNKIDIYQLWLSRHLLGPMKAIPSDSTRSTENKRAIINLSLNEIFGSFHYRTLRFQIKSRILDEFPEEARGEIQDT